MKDLNEVPLSPFILKISFNKYLERYEELAKSDDEFIAFKAKKIIESQLAYPILRDGFSEVAILEKYKKEISFILQDTFNEVLSLNEIKTASIPFHDIIFNSSQRFQNIIKTAGNNYELKIANIPVNEKYIFGMLQILPGAKR